MKKVKEKISIVVPVYGCPSAVKPLCRRLGAVCTKLGKDYEIILVNDACPLGSWEEIQSIAEKNKKIIGINFARNFGQHNAITAGLSHVTGDYVVVMDCDLQDQPEEIEKLYNELCKGFDVVFARRHQRKDTAIKRFSSWLFYKVYNYLTESNFDHSVANFSITKRIVIENFCKMNEQNRNFPLFIKWMGFKTGFKDVEHSTRYEGKTSYNFNRLLRLSVDSIVAQSNMPLEIFIKLGFFISFLSFVYALYIIYRYFHYSITLVGYASLITSVWFIGGMLMANMGVMGLYIGRIFNEAKARPLYIITETLNKKEVR